MKFYYKIHKTQYGNLIAISDKELLGKTIKNKDLDFNVSERFYGSELTDESVINFLDKCNDGNIIGNNIVNLFLKLEIIDKKSVVKIGNQKHAQFSILN
jgi:hypothetical protein